MANYYVLFSVMLHIDTDAELKWCREHIEELKKDRDENDNYDVGDFDYKIELTPGRTGGDIWFHADESGEPSHVADFVQSYFKHFKKNGTWALEWSNYCDKARLDAYGGGAVVVTATQQRWMNTNQWASNTVKQLSKVKARSKRKA